MRRAHDPFEARSELRKWPASPRRSCARCPCSRALRVPSPRLLACERAQVGTRPATRQRLCGLGRHVCDYLQESSLNERFEAQSKPDVKRARTRAERLNRLARLPPSALRLALHEDGANRGRVPALPALRRENTLVIQLPRDCCHPRPRAFILLMRRRRSLGGAREKHGPSA